MDDKNLKDLLKKLKTEESSPDVSKQRRKFIERIRWKNFGVIILGFIALAIIWICLIQGILGK